MSKHGDHSKEFLNDDLVILPKWFIYLFTDTEKVSGKPVFNAKNAASPNYDAYEKDIAMVTFFFESTTAFEYSRDERMTLIQYISQMGGLMGLCTGFSFISAVEIVYWFTIRYFRNL